MENQVQTIKQVQGFISSPQVYLDTERGVLTHRLSNDLRIEMSINLYKKILGIPFEKKEQKESPEVKALRRSVFGLIARPVIYISKDGNYLIHSVLGIRVSKHINYYKQILGAGYTPETKTA